MPTEPPAIHVCACEPCQAGTDPVLAAQHTQINLFLSRLSEPQRRWYVALLSQAPAAPTDRQLALITGLDRHTIQCGRTELAAGLLTPPAGTQRRPGAGRPCAEKKIPR